MSALWYAMRSKPCREGFLWNQLRTREIECFYPCIRARSSNPRARQGRPYFPGYIFIHADLERVGLSAIQWMPGRAGLVAFGGQPAWVPENLIHAIRRRVARLWQGYSMVIRCSFGRVLSRVTRPFSTSAFRAMIEYGCY